MTGKPRLATNDEIIAMAALETCKRIQNKRDRWAAGGFVSLSRSTLPVKITDDRIDTLWWLVWTYRNQVKNKRAVLMAKVYIEKQDNPKPSLGDAEKLRRWREATE